jgi:hypothetical protein
MDMIKHFMIMKNIIKILKMKIIVGFSKEKSSEIQK